MISEKEKEIISSCAAKYKAGSIYLFGSSLADDRSESDIDLGVKGINPSLFFKFYAELLRLLSRPVDLVDLSNRSLFAEWVEQRGIRIYG